jgi:23S rRNA (pseudouridine1915-N3)-methyltransferase
VKLQVAAVGQRMPAWVDQAWTEYARRFPPSLPLELKEIRMPQRARNADTVAMRRREGKALLASAPAGALLVALDSNGRQWSTEELAETLESWMQQGRDVSFFIGGPDGLDQSCLDQADVRWSLGRATFPHPLVRVMVAEQLYRAWSITQNHPYHRA